ncbi:YggS family pyridoxal phosphate-dependent enzyme [Nocardia abscessus]|uniref:Pyridoxal phosphate homeostasis protein n=1 Tax=Nocardia abscessus TaxID=120957 RepID=A0ABS0CCV7_9NOCA|nr:YggS family pyridoxal phosphate-dependent enzyme [Nocardia abscessus]MBF6227675.1 YggS family pyridoxal phosphate-dependent enzyme [Nocardia abscessus]
MSAETGIAVDGSLAARTAELSENLAGLLVRIDAACRAAGRAPDSVRLLPVTKFFPASDVAILHRLGRREFGESREQEAAAKVSALREEDLTDIRWHMIGRLQRNKARNVVRWAHTVHSVDSERLATALDAGAVAALEAGERTEPVRVLLQVSLDDDPARGGVAADDLPVLAERIANASGLRLSGLMAIPPLGVESDAAFARLATLHTLLLAVHPDATELSAGMSGDLESAIEHGSTVVRVGTALMGMRPITSG